MTERDRWIRGAALALLLAGCVRPSAGYQCASDTQCSGGTCEPNGYCSFADTTCTSGRRFGEQSGPVANQCVADTTPMADASVDDASMVVIDAPPAGPDAAPVMPTFLAEAHSNAGAVASLTYALNVPAGANYLVVSVHLASNCGGLVPDVTSVKFNNVSLARFATITGTPCGMATTRSDQWGLVAPPTGAFEVVVTLAAATPFTIHSGAMAFGGVHQVTPVRASSTSRSDNTAISVMVASAPYDLIIETAGTGGQFNTPGLGQTMVFRNNASSQNTLDNSAASTKPGAAGMVTVSWSVADDESQQIASSLRPL